jgi:Flp pilus assembly protein TadG
MPAIGLLLLGIVLGVALTILVQMVSGVTLGASECSRAISRYERAQRAFDEAARSTTVPAASLRLQEELSSASLGMRRLCPGGP